MPEPQSKYAVLQTKPDSVQQIGRFLTGMSDVANALNLARSFRRIGGLVAQA